MNNAIIILIANLIRERTKIDWDNEPHEIGYDAETLIEFLENSAKDELLYEIPENLVKSIKSILNDLNQLPDSNDIVFDGESEEDKQQRLSDAVHNSATEIDDLINELKKFLPMSKSNMNYDVQKDLIRKAYLEKSQRGQWLRKHYSNKGVLSDNVIDKDDFDKFDRYGS
tara:strand:+ start:114 stop:623 length:510 start_codon:yes stop_codon:yes gene_type:complete